MKRVNFICTHTQTPEPASSSGVLINNANQRCSAQNPSVVKVSTKFSKIRNNSKQQALYQSYLSIDQNRKDRGKMRLHCSKVFETQEQVPETTESPDLTFLDRKIGGDSTCWHKILTNYNPTDEQAEDFFLHIINDSSFGTNEPLSLRQIYEQYTAQTGPISKQKDWDAEYCNIWMHITEMDKEVMHLHEVYKTPLVPTAPVNKNEVIMNMAQLVLYFNPNNRFKNTMQAKPLEMEKKEKAVRKGIDTRHGREGSRDSVNKVLCNVGEKKVGVLSGTKSYLLKNNFFSNMEYALDNEGGSRYRDMVDNHDTRIVNNHYAKSNYELVKTTMPSKRLIGGNYEDMDHTQFVAVDTSVQSEDKQFLTDVSTVYAYNNCAADKTTVYGECALTLGKQPWYSLNTNLNNKNLITTEFDIGTFFDYELIYFICPVVGVDTDGKLAKEGGSYAYYNNMLLVTYGSSSVVHSYSKNVANIMSGSNHLNEGEHSLTVLARKRFDFMQVIVLTPAKLEIMQLTENDEAWFEVPVIAPTLFGAIGVPDITMKRYKLNKPALNRLINKNLTGKVSYELMMEYAMAMSWYSYNKRGVELASEKFSAEELKVHVYVSRVLVTLQKLNDQIENLIYNDGPNKLLIAAFDAMTSVAMELTDADSPRSTVVRKFINAIENPIVRAGVGAKMKVWMSLDAWTMSRHIEVSTYDQPSACNHHQECLEPYTGITCLHCGYNTALNDSIWCRCCSVTLNECYHVCEFEHSGDNVCTCCHKNHSNEGEWCDCCLRKYPIQEEVEAVDPVKTIKSVVRERKKASKPVNEIEAPKENNAKPEPHKQKEAEKLPFTLDLSYAQLRQSLPEHSLNLFMGRSEIGKRYTNDEKLSLIPFVTNRHPLALLEKYELYDVNDVTVVDCGVDCCKFYLGLEFSEYRLKAVTGGKTRGLSADQIGKMLNDAALNACVIDASGLKFFRCNDGEQFACVVHTSALKDAEYKNHWLVCKVNLISADKNEMFLSNMNTVVDHNNAAVQLFRKYYNSLNDDEKLFCCYTLASKSQASIVSGFNKFEFTKERLMNSDEHDPSKGLYNYTVQSRLAKYATMLVDSMSGSINDELNQIWDINDDNCLDVLYNTECGFRDCCYKIALILSNPVGHCRTVKKLVKRSGMRVYIEVDDVRLKNGDLVFFKQGVQYKPTFVKVVAGKIDVVLTDKQSYSYIDLLIPKASVSSLLMRMYSYNEVKVDKDKLIQLYKTGKFVIGPGGSGKSTSIATWRKEEPTVSATFVAMTTGGKTSLQLKLPIDDNPQSFEKASISHINTQLVVVDEATLIRPWELALVVGPMTQKIMLAGDPTQISVIDLYASGGTRISFNAVNYAKKYSDVLTLTSTYRIGSTLVNELKLHKAMSDLNSLASHDTTFDCLWMEKFTPNEINKLAVGCNVILVFYGDQIALVNNALDFRSVKTVTTVHRYQGLESDVVMVLQMPLSRQADTHRQFGHCISAATRPVKHLKWVTIADFSSETPLHDRLGGDIGSLEYQVIEGIELHDEVHSALNSGVAKVDIKKFNPEFFTATVTEHTKLVNVSYDIDDDKVQINLKALFHTATYVVDSGGRVSTNVPDEYVKVVEDLFIKSCNVECDYVVKKKEKYISIAGSDAWILRIVAFVIKVYTANNLTYSVEHNGEKFNLQVKPSECAACGEIKVYKGDELIGGVTRDYVSLSGRLAWGESAEMVKDMLILNKGGLPDYIIDPQLSHAILTERVSTALKDFNTAVSSSFTRFLWYNKYENSLLFEEIKNTIGAKITVTNCDNMSLYPYFRKTLTGWKISKIGNNNSRIVVTRSKAKKLEAIYECLLILHERYKDDKTARYVSRFYMSAIGARNDEDRIPGMMESFDWHKSNKTATYRDLVNRQDMVKMKSVKYMPQMTYVPKNVFTFCSKFTNLDMFASNKRMTTSDPLVSAADMTLARLIRDTYPSCTVNFINHTIYTSYVLDFGLTSPSKATGEVAHTLNQDLYHNMLTNHAGHVKVDDPMYSTLLNEVEKGGKYTGLHTKPDVIVTDPTILNIDNQILLDWVYNASVVYFWVPLECHNINNTLIYAHKDSNTPFECKKEWHDAIEKGFSLNFDDVKLGVKVHTLKTFDAIRVCMIQREEVGLWAEPWLTNARYVNIMVPSFIFDLESVVSRGALLEMQLATINIDTLENLRRRLLKPDTTFDDLLVQARTLLNTTQYTTSMVRGKYEEKVHEMYRTAKIAWAIHNTENKMFSLLVDPSSIFDLLCMLPAVAAAKFIDKFKSVVSPYVSSVKAMIDTYEKKSDILKVLSKFVNSLEKLKPLQLAPTKTIVNSANQMLTRESRWVPKIKLYITKRIGLTEISWDDNCPTCDATMIGVLNNHFIKSLSKYHTMVHSSDCERAAGKTIGFEDTCDIKVVTPLLGRHGLLIRPSDLDLVKGKNIGIDTVKPKLYVNCKLILTEVNIVTKISVAYSKNCMIKIVNDVDTSELFTSTGGGSVLITEDNQRLSASTVFDVSSQDAWINSCGLSYNTRGWNVTMGEILSYNRFKLGRQLEPMELINTIDAIDSGYLTSLGFVSNGKLLQKLSNCDASVVLGEAYVDVDTGYLISDIAAYSGVRIDLSSNYAKSARESIYGRQFAKLDCLEFDFVEDMQVETKFKFKNGYDYECLNEPQHVVSSTSVLLMNRTCECGSNVIVTGGPIHPRDVKLAILSHTTSYDKGVYHLNLDTLITDKYLSVKIDRPIDTVSVTSSLDTNLEDVSAQNEDHSKDEVLNSEEVTKWFDTCDENGIKPLAKMSDLRTEYVIYTSDGTFPINDEDMLASMSATVTKTRVSAYHDSTKDEWVYRNVNVYEVDNSIKHPFEDLPKVDYVAKDLELAECLGGEMNDVVGRYKKEAEEMKVHASSCDDDNCKYKNSKGKHLFSSCDENCLTHHSIECEMKREVRASSKLLDDNGGAGTKIIADLAHKEGVLLGRHMVNTPCVRDVNTFTTDDDKSMIETMLTSVRMKLIDVANTQALEIEGTIAGDPQYSLRNMDDSKVYDYKFRFVHLYSAEADATAESHEAGKRLIEFNINLPEHKRKRDESYKYNLMAYRKNNVFEEINVPEHAQRVWVSEPAVGDFSDVEMNKSRILSKPSYYKRLNLDGKIMDRKYYYESTNFKKVLFKVLDVVDRTNNLCVNILKARQMRESPKDRLSNRLIQAETARPQLEVGLVYNSAVEVKSTSGTTIPSKDQWVLHLKDWHWLRNSSLNWDERYSIEINCRHWTLGEMLDYLYYDEKGPVINKMKGTSYQWLNHINALYCKPWTSVEVPETTNKWTKKSNGKFYDQTGPLHAELFTIPLSALWPKGTFLRVEGMKFSRDTLKLVDYGARYNAWCLLHMIATMTKNIWIPISAPSDFVTAMPVIRGMNCCSDTQPYDYSKQEPNRPMNPEHVLKNLPKKQRTSWSPEMCTLRSVYIQIAVSRDGDWSYGLCQNAYNNFRPYIAAAKHGLEQKLITPSLPLVRAIPHLPNWSGHTLTWPGTYDKSWQLGGAPFSPNTGAVVLPPNTKINYPITQEMAKRAGYLHVSDAESSLNEYYQVVKEKSKGHFDTRRAHRHTPWSERFPCGHTKSNMFNKCRHDVLPLMFSDYQDQKGLDIEPMVNDSTELIVALNYNGRKFDGTEVSWFETYMGFNLNKANGLNTLLIMERQDSESRSRNVKGKNDSTDDNDEESEDNGEEFGEKGQEDDAYDTANEDNDSLDGESDKTEQPRKTSEEQESVLSPSAQTYVEAMRQRLNDLFPNKRAMGSLGEWLPINEFEQRIEHNAQTTGLKLTGRDEIDFFIKLIGNDTKKSDLDVMLDIELRKFVDKPEKYTYNPLLGGRNNKRLALGRDLLEMENCHSVSKIYNNCPKLAEAHYDFLKNLQSKVDGLNIQEHELVHWYSLCPGIAMRSPAKLPGRHIHIGISDRKITDLGFETLELGSDPGRFGACLRVICALLANVQCTHFFHSGRPNLHVLFAEMVIGEILDDITVNTVVAPFSTCGPFLDGMVLVDTFKAKDAARYISQNIWYREIYGIDEKEFTIFGIKECWYLGDSGAWYSNMNVNKLYKSWAKGINMHLISGQIRGKFPYGMDKVIQASSGKTDQKLVNKLDPNTLKEETRGKEPLITTTKTDSHIDKTIQQVQVEVDESMSEIVPVIGGVDFHNILFGEPNSNTSLEEYKFTDNKVMETLHNPQVTRDCPFKAIEWALKYVVKLKFTSTVLRSVLKFKDFMNDDEIISRLKLIGHSFTYSGSSKSVMFSCKNNLGEVEKPFNLYVTSDQIGRTHLTVVKMAYRALPLNKEWSTFEPLAEKMNPIEPTESTLMEMEAMMMGVLPATGPMKEQLQNVNFRMNGNVARIMERSESVIETRASRAEGKWLWVSNLSPGKVYLFQNKLNRFEPRIVMNSQTGTFIRGGVDQRVAIDMGTRLWSTGNEMSRTIRSEASIGFLNAASKIFANDIAHELAAWPIDREANLILFSDFDNRNHHHADDADLLRRTRVGNIRIICRKEDNMTWGVKMLEALYKSGPVRLAVRQGIPYITCLVKTPWIQKLYEGLDEQSILYEDMVEMVTKFDKVNLEKSGNDFMPVVQRLFSKFKRKYNFGGPGQPITHKLTGAELTKDLMSFGAGDHKFKIEEFTHYELSVERNTTPVYLSGWIDNEHYDPKSWSHMVVSAVGYGKELDETNTVDELQGEFKGFTAVAAEYNKVANSSTKLQEISDESMANIVSLNTMNTMRLEDNSDSYKLYTSTSKAPDVILVGFSAANDAINGDVVEEQVHPNMMDYYDDETHMLDSGIPLPNKNIRLVHNGEFSGIKNVAKASMVQYPTHSQSAYIGSYRGGLKAVSELYGSKLELRQVEHDARQDCRLFEETYFINGSTNALPEINIDYNTVLDWLKERPDSEKILKDFDEVISGGLDIVGMDKVNIHEKLESRMKDVLMEDFEKGTNMPETLEEQRNRLIAWQRKGITMIFASFFKQVKDHLKRCLRKEIVYVDGMTPPQICALLNQIDGTDITFAEDDLKKQDRQTDHTLLDTEMEIYKRLGANPRIVDMWRTVHNKWRGKGIGIKFVSDASRHTGQATTAIGNAIVNLIVKQRLVKRLGKKLKLMLILGDDNIILTEGKITESEISLNSARHYNMQSDPSVRKDYGTFLRMMIYRRKDGMLECGPDVVRLCRRFQVLNGVSEQTDENVKMRTISYCCMLGDNQYTRKIISDIGKDVKLQSWFDMGSLMEVTAGKYQTTVEKIEGVYGWLLKMMREREVVIRYKLVPVEKRQ
ncbi:polyprotein [Rhizoctonia solani endornavirus 2]|uniref:Polyprotein n=1 Tax=Rhizoctonia solani endornavirus 2 TaxID=1807787 RepID=A0A127AXE9_9VIRU|nr:polyprotein [Rhizoctonia solani endornavirus 2]AMM45288.1 polyprotein [Rhizoctonia solani endornavirus 2]